MGQARNKQRQAFASALIEEWEANDCVDFAVALARTTGWLLHVDWWSISTDYCAEMPVDQLRPLRVYVADNHDRIFDVRGIMSIAEFNERVVRKTVTERYPGPGCVYTRFYDEAKLSTLPLRRRPDETLIARALDEIDANKFFLGAIAPRRRPCIPAHHAARYTFGRCAAFAEAMREVTGLEPVALLAVRFSPLFAGTRRGETGYFHSVVLHSDGMAEDAWGKASVEEIANRFGAIEFKMSSGEHRKVVDRIRKSSSELYESEKRAAIELIHANR